MPDMHASTMSEPLPATVSSCSAGKIQKHCTCTSMSTSRCKGLSFTYTQCKQTIAASSRSRPVAWFCYKPLRLQDRSCATAHRNTRKSYQSAHARSAHPEHTRECSSEYLQSPIASTCRITFTSSGSQPGSRHVLDSVDDPSAGSPTETLLRLLLPVSHKIHETSQRKVQKLSTAAVLITGSLNR